MGTFAPRLDILPPAQRNLWSALEPAVRLGLVLYGGTAIALRLGHRQSVDFDLFSHAALNRTAIEASFSFMREATVLQDSANALSVLVTSGDVPTTHVKVSFFGTIEFGRVGVPDMTEDRVLNVASLADLMATKLKVVLQRAEAKDYRDIAAMIRADISLAQGLADARTLFGPSFQPSESLKALVYYADGDLRTLGKDDKNTLVRAVSAVGNLPLAKLLCAQLAPAP